ncbi:MFS transporter [Burkholderia ubonensis]|uniref:MFS transporter n=1 Tax=Burkholderia ubonensis TaxID=101571 RepID=UPI002AB28CA5|nr:MFS transporter [Burkholderia ubonensis]
MKNENAVIAIASLMAVGSGVLLVYAPWSVTVSSGTFSGTGRFFLFYVITTIALSAISGRFIDTFGGHSALSLAIIFRIALLLIWMLLTHTAPNQHWMVVLSLAAMAALPDSLYRSSIPAITKAAFSDEALLRINGLISAWRQIGYIVGTLLGAISVSAQDNVFALVQIAIGIICGATQFHMRRAGNFRRQASGSPRRKIGFGVGADAFQFTSRDSPALVISLVLFGSAVVLLPMNAAPYVIEVKQLPSFNLGLIEAAFSVGTLCGAVYFSRSRNQSIQLAACALLAFGVGAVPYATAEIAIALYLTIGFFIQVSIPLGTTLQIRCPGRLIGQVASLVSLISSLIAASMMMIVSTGRVSGPKAVYFLLSGIFAVSLVLVLISFRAAPVSIEPKLEGER